MSDPRDKNSEWLRRMREATARNAPEAPAATADVLTQKLVQELGDLRHRCGAFSERVELLEKEREGWEKTIANLKGKLNRLEMIGEGAERKREQERVAVIKRIDERSDEVFTAMVKYGLGAVVILAAIVVLCLWDRGRESEPPVAPPSFSDVTEGKESR